MVGCDAGDIKATGGPLSKSAIKVDLAEENGCGRRQFGPPKIPMIILKKGREPASPRRILKPVGAKRRPDRGEKAKRL